MIDLKPATLLDAAILYLWRIDPATVAASPGPIPIWHEHVEWLKRTLADSNRKLYVAFDGMQAIGTGRLDRVASGVELSITVAPDWRRKGYAPRIIEALCREAWKWLPGGRTIAHVRPENRASLRAFLSAGFTPMTTELLTLEKK